MAELLTFPPRVIWIAPGGERCDITRSQLGAAIRRSADAYRAAGGVDPVDWLDEILPDSAGAPGELPDLRYCDGGRVIGDWARIEIEEIEDPADDWSAVG